MPIAQRHPCRCTLDVHSRFNCGEMVDELARLGLSVNYRRVMYLEEKMGLSMIQQFTYEGVVAPPGLRRGLFSVGDTDNILWVTLKLRDCIRLSKYKIKMFGDHQYFYFTLL